MKQSYRFAILLSVIVLGLSCSNRETPIVEVESVTINTQKAEMIVGETIQLSAIVKPDNATDKKVTWKSNNESVVSVSSSGLVTANKEGNAVITALAGKCVSVCEISVIKEDVAVTSIELDKSSVNLAVGESTTLTATIKPENASVKTVTWVSSNSEVAQVEGDGKVTGVNEGQARVTANAGGKTAECKVTVTTNKVSVESIELDQSSVSLKEGESITLVATIKPENATDKTVTWTSSNNDVAKVDENGVVSAISEGSTIITAKAGGIETTCSITVVSASFKPNGEYLAFTGLDEQSSISYTINSGDLEYSYDTKSWYSWKSSLTITLAIGVKVFVRGNKIKGLSFKMTGRIAASGNVMSLLYYDDFANKNCIDVDNAFMWLFRNCNNLIEAPDLPATILAEGCYSGMFSGCTSLTNAPNLPATTLASDCYSVMFSGCTSLTKAPELPATTMAEWCYSGMFSGCTSLTKAPDLPATTLAERCYLGMFSSCTSLKEAPSILPATTLAERCYEDMFSGCTSLIEAPEISVTTVANYCCMGMFSGCTSLTKAPSILPATTLAEFCYASMFSGCTGLTNAPNLPATTLAGQCYNSMFKKCESLTKAPELPATTLAYGCCSWMFSSCTSLKEAPSILPATTLADQCYNNMFSYCTSLTTAPELPATTLAHGCYGDMFLYCTSLTTAPELPATTLASNCYAHMFSSCTNLTKAPDLPATTLASNCYDSMFGYCSSLTKAPDLPATTLADDCYSGMFSGCTSLTKAPDLPATTLAERCYLGMFSSCTSLKEAPSILPATTLAERCYYGMFGGCTSLTTAPELPATTLAEGCCFWMFSECTGLTKAPVLPATTLAEPCYVGMFLNCSNLNEIKMLAINIANKDFVKDFLKGTAKNGTFIKHASAKWTEEGIIPIGWTVKTATE